VFLRAPRTQLSSLNAFGESGYGARRLLQLTVLWAQRHSEVVSNDIMSTSLWEDCL
jgi:hypothetical protein